MNLLCIETSSFISSSIALFQESFETCVEEKVLSSGKTQGKSLLPEVQNLLQSHQLKPADLHAIAVDCGPGSFTGVRIGLATAEGLALAHQIPIFGVSSLQILCMRAKEWVKEHPHGYLCPCLDARKGKIYTGLFAMENQTPIAKIPEMHISPHHWYQKLSIEISHPAPVLFLGDAVPLFAQDIASLTTFSSITQWSQAEVCFPRAQDFPFLLQKELDHGIQNHPSRVHPRYLRPVNEEFLLPPAAHNPTQRKKKHSS